MVSRENYSCYTLCVSYSDKIKKYKDLYKNLQPCYCKTLGETVHFNADGLNHLLYNRRRPRSKKEQLYRANLIPYICTVIENSKTATKQLLVEKPTIVTWSLECEIAVTGGKRVIKVILCKKGAGNVTFLSAMQKRFIANNKN